MRSWIPMVLAMAVGCNSTSIREGDQDTEGDTASSLYDDARLVIVSPESGEWLELDEDYNFEAVLTDADGDELDYDEVFWSSDVDDGWEEEGLSFERDDLDAGTHAITAEVTLPNGDRLAYTAGGVRVQSAYAGTYAGTVIVDATYDTTTVSCSGSAVMRIDDEGELAEGDASCLLSINGYDLDLEYVFDADVDSDGDMEGEAGAVIFTWEIPFDFEGEVDDEGEMTGEFEGGSDTLGLTFAGELALERVSRETE